MKHENSTAKASFIALRFIFCIWIIFLYACGSDGSNGGESSGTGSLSFQLSIQDDQAAFSNELSQQSEDDMDCKAHGINTLDMQIFDENNKLLAIGGPWDCEAYEKIVRNIPAGDNRKCEAYAKDSAGYTLYSQKMAGITILPNQVNDLGTVYLEENTCPVADAGDDQNATVDDTVTLDGSGSYDINGDPLTWFWELVDMPAESDATLDNPTAVKPSFYVDQQGVYVAELIVSDGICDSDPDEVTIGRVNICPVADAGEDQSATVGDTVKLDGSASFDPDSLPEPLTFFWELIDVPNDSNASLDDPNAEKPSFYVDQPGEYTAQLIVNDGLCDSDPVTVKIGGVPCPVADAGDDQNVPVRGVVTLDGSRSYDPDGKPLTFFWSFTSVPPGSTAQLSDPFSEKPRFTADKPGIYVAQLSVNNGSCESDPPDTVTIEANTCPKADAGPNRNVNWDENLIVILDGSGSYDPDLYPNPLTYIWLLTAVPDGSTARLYNKRSEKPWFKADKPGFYRAQLNVNDGLCDSLFDIVVIRVNICPVADAGGDQSATVGDTVKLDGSASFDPDSLPEPPTFFWELIDVPNDSNASLDDPNAEKPSFYVDQPGEYTAQLIVNDGLCDSDPAEITITANEEQ
jgi:hypothetical protein